MNASPKRRRARPQVDLVPRDRVLALTDGVTAIAMTLLVLDIELPEGLDGVELRRALDDVQSQVGAFLLSAVVIALFWRAHHAVVRNAEGIDLHAFWLNVAFLVLVSLIPFPTHVLQTYGDRFLGPGLYGAVIGAAALVLYGLDLHVSRSAGANWRSVTLPAQAIVFLASVGIARISPLAAIYSWAASVPLSVLADRIAARARERR
ncbi:TMEM175 family protein [Streptomyces sp. NPDC052016]|uniref:TMEM175 family protein n=1 Tax=Streptomyces sp. NPDC052016 TaxID=3365680 RepID=UPI0037CE125F